MWNYNILLKFYETCKACFDIIGAYWQIRLQCHSPEPNPTIATDYIADKQKEQSIRKILGK